MMNLEAIFYPIRWKNQKRTCDLAQVKMGIPKRFLWTLILSFVFVVNLLVGPTTTLIK